MAKFGLDLKIWGLNMFLVSNVVEIHIIGFFYVQMCPDLFSWILCKQNSVFLPWRFGDCFWALACRVSLCALEEPEDLADQCGGGLRQPTAFTFTTAHIQLSCNLFVGSAFCVAGEECLWLRKRGLWAGLPGLKPGRLLPFTLSVGWPSCKVMQFDLCVKRKVLQMRRKSMGKRRDTPFHMISSRGGSKAGN